MKECNVYEGNLIAEDLSFGIVISRWHELVNSKLLEGSLDTIKRHGGDLSKVDIFYVPGSFEIPLMAQKLCEDKKYNAVIAIGTIIRGQTLHFDLIANEVVKGLAKISLSTGVPISLGVLASDSLDLAFERAGSKHGNKGSEAALSAIEMANLFKK